MAVNKVFKATLWAAVIIAALPAIWIAGWHIRMRFSETPQIIFKEYGLTASEWGTQTIYDMEFDLHNSMVTSVVCTVENKNFEVWNKQSVNNATYEESTIGIKDIVHGEGWYISVFREPQSGIYNLQVNNCSSNLLIGVKVNEIELKLPCCENELIGKLGRNYKKVIIKGRL